MLAEALATWIAGTFQNTFSAVIIIVMGKWLMSWSPEVSFKGTQGPEQGYATVHWIVSPALRKVPDRAHSQNAATDHKAAKWAGHPLYAENLWDAIFFRLAKLVGMLNVINFYTKHVLLFFF